MQPELILGVYRARDSADEEYFILKDKLTLKKLILIIVSFIGVIIISVKDYSNIFLHSQRSGRAFTLGNVYRNTSRIS